MKEVLMRTVDEAKALVSKVRYTFSLFVYSYSIINVFV